MVTMCLLSRYQPLSANPVYAILALCTTDQLGSNGFMINTQLKKQLIDLSTDHQLAGQ